MAHLPKVVYEHLPNFYIILVVGVAIGIEHPIGVISSLLMVATGLFIFNLSSAHNNLYIAKLMSKNNDHA